MILLTLGIGLGIALCWLLSKSDGPMHIAHWSDARAKYYEAETYRYLGIRPQASYLWSKQFKPKPPRKRKSADVLTMAKSKRSA